VNITDLLVLHQKKDTTGLADWLVDCPSPDAPGFFVDTCMRQLAVPATPELGDSIAAYAAGNSLELFRGSDAYQFLLEVSTGLHSAVPGETNILGQLKSAWQRSVASLRRDDVVRLQPVFDSVMRDANTIRQEYLQGLGGNSYGSLARKLIQPNTSSRVLFVGSGELTQSMLPFFRNTQSGIWNYRLPVNAPEWVQQVFEPDDHDAAAEWANTIVLTTPPDETNDRRWTKHLQEYPMQTVLHLGLRREQPGRWQQFPSLLTLDDIFDLRQSQDDVRNIQIQRARSACAEYAVERSRAGLGAATHIACA